MYDSLFVRRGSNLATCFGFLDDGQFDLLNDHVSVLCLQNKQEHNVYLKINVYLDVCIDHNNDASWFNSRKIAIDLQETLSEILRWLSNIGTWILSCNNNWCRNLHCVETPGEKKTIFLDLINAFLWLTQPSSKQCLAAIVNHWLLWAAHRTLSVLPRKTLIYDWSNKVKWQFTFCPLKKRPLFMENHWFSG